MSPAYEQIWGRPTAELFARPQVFYESIHPDDGLMFAQGVSWHQWGRGGEFRIVRPDGAVRWIGARAFPVHREDGAVYRVVGVFEDVTERKETEAQLAHQAYYDPLTGLPNRHFFTERLAQSIADRDEQGERIALFFLDSTSQTASRRSRLSWHSPGSPRSDCNWRSRKACCWTTRRRRSWRWNR